MSDLAHRLTFDGCACGSAWNYIDKGCSSILPLATVSSFSARWPEDDFDTDFFECRKGHAHCGRH